jgi:hypothetical protein
MTSEDAKADPRLPPARARPSAIAPMAVSAEPTPASFAEMTQAGQRRREGGDGWDLAAGREVCSGHRDEDPDDIGDDRGPWLEDELRAGELGARAARTVP